MSTVVGGERRRTLHLRVRLIVGFTITWNVVEAMVAISAGAIASSAALVGFGLDSVIEVASAAAVAWQFTRKDPQRWEKATLRTIGIAFFALAGFISVDAIRSLTGEGGVEHSPVGIGIVVLSLIVMPVLAWFEFRTGRELGSRSVQADAKQLLLCCYLSGTVLIGLLANSLFGWQWADSIAALVVAGLAIREGVEAWRGDIESPVLVLHGRAADGYDEPPAVPFGCAQPPAERQTRQRRWQAFEEDYALQVERTDTRLVIHCANVEDSLARLRTLVDSERECCAFAQWDIDTEQQDLRLIVATAPGRVAGLNVG